MTIEWISPDELRNHPTNIAIYGDTPDQDLIESVKAHGVFEDHPIGYVMDGDFRRIVSGHRRNQAAKINKLDMVPVVRLKDIEDDPLAIEERIILSNKQRVKTNEQIARELAKLKAIREQRTKEVSRANLKQNSEKPLENPSGSIDHLGPTRKHLAESVGVSEGTAQRLIVAGEALQDAEKKGHTKKADAIKKGLEKSAAAGAEAAKPKPPKNGSVIPPVYDDKKIDKPLGAIRRELDERLKAFPQTERLFRAAKHALGEFVNRINEWRGAK